LQQSQNPAITKSAILFYCCNFSAMSFAEQMNVFSKNDPDRPSRKKPMFPVNDQLRAYLKQHGREVKLPVAYRDLLNYTY